MLPPPSPNRSRTCSPQLRTSARPYDAASPDKLRSPAITRVLNESQSPHRQTRYPFPRRSSNSSNHEMAHQPFPINSETRNIDLDAGTTTTSQADSSMLQPLASKSTIPIPPPIPTDDPAPIKQAKRGARRKSAVQDSGAKIGKNRSVTGTAASGNSKTLAKRNITGATAKAKDTAKTKLKQRAVTAVLTGKSTEPRTQDHGSVVSSLHRGGEGHADVDVPVFVEAESETMDWEESGFNDSEQTEDELHLSEKEARTRVRRSARLRVRGDE